MYLPNVGLMLFIINVLSFIHPALWLLLFGAHVSLLIAYMPMYKDMNAYFEHHVSIDPLNDYGWNALMNIANAKKDTIGALHITERAIRAGVKSPRLQISRAALLHTIGHKEHALISLGRAKEYSKDYTLPILTDKIDEMVKQINTQ